MEAEGRFEASKKDAQAQVVLAQGSEQSIRLIAQAIGEREIPIVYLLGEQYIKAMTDMAKSPNAKTVVLPADILSTVRGMMGESSMAKAGAKAGLNTQLAK